MNKKQWMYLALGLAAVGGYMWYKSQDKVTMTAKVPQSPMGEQAEEEQQFLGIKSGSKKKLKKVASGLTGGIFAVRNAVRKK
jgi:hypothetical protein